MKNIPTEFYRAYRPLMFKQMLGQGPSLRNLAAMVGSKRLPHALLLTGPSGCGKTTVARILKTKLGCSDPDFKEINAADFRGIDTIREIRNHMGFAPVQGAVRMWLIDECHKLSGDAQNAFLKLLEDTPAHVYFVLATTDPARLLKTVVNRCTEVKLRPLSESDMRTLLTTIATKEKIVLAEESLDRLVEFAQGSARYALVMLNKLAGVDDEAEQLELIERNAAVQEGISIGRLLLDSKTDWKEMCAVLKAAESEPEQIRWQVLGYCESVMLSGGPKVARAYLIIQSFRDPFYETKKAGLLAACFEIVSKR